MGWSTCDFCNVWLDKFKALEDDRLRVAGWTEKVGNGVMDHHKVEMLLLK